MVCYICSTTGVGDVDAEECEEVKQMFEQLRGSMKRRRPGGVRASGWLPPDDCQKTSNAAEHLLARFCIWGVV